jgi:hypothetical protein
MLPTVLLLAVSAQAGRIVFQEQEPRVNRRFEGTDIYTENIWGSVQFTTAAPNATTTSPNTTMGAPSCPAGVAWCDHPAHYPVDVILRAVQTQGDSVKILFPASEKKVLKLPPGAELDDTVLGLRRGQLGELTAESEGSGEGLGVSGRDAGVESSGDAAEEEGSGANDADYEFTEAPEDGFENICGLTTEYIMPRAAKNKDGQFRFIVNHPEGGGEQYIQLVRVARCAGAGEECGWGVMAGVKTRCQQEYLDHKLVALSEDGEELVIDTFTFPSCCTCLMKTRDLFK